MSVSQIFLSQVYLSLTDTCLCCFYYFVMFRIFQAINLIGAFKLTRTCFFFFKVSFKDLLSSFHEATRASLLSSIYLKNSQFCLGTPNNVSLPPGSSEGTALTLRVWVVVYGPEDFYNFPYPRLLSVKNICCKGWWLKLNLYLDGCCVLCTNPSSPHF